MSDRELIAALNRLKVETGSLACMGCGYEHNCGIHGCAVIREVSETLQRFQWIPVTERLPAEGMRVLAAAEGVFSGEAYLGCGGRLDALLRRGVGAFGGYARYPLDAAAGNSGGVMQWVSGVASC